MIHPNMHVSVIIPARNEDRFIGRCIASLRSMETLGRSLEIIVVDNASTDETGMIAAGLGVKVLRQEGGLVGSVRNRGATESIGEVLAFIDADCVAPPTWLSSALSYLNDEKVGIVGGHYVPNPQGTWVERARAAPNPPKEPRDSDSLPGGSMIMRREVFTRVGGFAEDLSAGEDDDLCRKIAELGLRVVALPDCYVIHLGFPATLRDVARRQIWHGSSQLDVAPSVFDGQLLLTHSFAIGLGLLAAGLALSSHTITLVALPFLGAPVAILSLRKSAVRERPVLTFAKVLPIAVFYYSGRVIGLMRNYVRLLVSTLPQRFTGRTR